MQIKVQSKEILRALSAAINAVEQRVTIPVLGNVLLKAEGGSLEVTATDLEVAIITRCPCEVVESGSSTVLAKRFFDYVKLLPDAEMTVKTDDKWHINASCVRSRTRIPGLEPEAFPQTPAIPSPAFSLPTSTLLRLIQGTDYCVPASQQKSAIPCGLLSKTSDGWSMSSVDEHRVARVASSQDFGRIEGTLIPIRSMHSLPKVFAETEGGSSVMVSEDSNHLFFSCCGTVLIQRGVQGRFPDYSKLTDAGTGDAVTVDRKVLLAAVERALGFTGLKSKRIQMDVKAPNLTVLADSNENGESEESVECSGSMVEKFGINGSYVVEFLRAVPADQATIARVNGFKTVLLVSQVGAIWYENYIMLMS